MKNYKTYLKTELRTIANRAKRIKALVEMHGECKRGCELPRLAVELQSFSVAMEWWIKNWKEESSI